MLSDLARVLTTGHYPETSLAEARLRCAKIRADLAAGRDPDNETPPLADAPTGSTRPCFETIASEWHELNRNRWKSHHAADVLDSLQREVFPTIGAKPIDQITPPEILALLEPVQRRGAVETAHRLRNRISAAFGLAIARGYITTDPAERIGKALMPIVRQGKRPP